MNARHLRIDASVIAYLIAAAVDFVVTVALAYCAITANPIYWIAAALIAATGILLTVCAYFWAQTAWLRADTARLQADTARMYAVAAERRRNQ